MAVRICSALAAGEQQWVAEPAAELAAEPAAAPAAVPLPAALHVPAAEPAAVQAVGPAAESAGVQVAVLAAVHSADQRQPLEQQLCLCEKNRVCQSKHMQVARACHVIASFTNAYRLFAGEPAQDVAGDTSPGEQTLPLAAAQCLHTSKQWLETRHVNARLISVCSHMYCLV